jgi:hypothetical protein
MLYLIHFDSPYKHARHYRGYCADGELAARLARHRSGHGARLLSVVAAAGIGWRCVRTWPGGRQQERTLKRRKVAPLCPCCTPALRSTVVDPEAELLSQAAVQAAIAEEIPF